MNKKKRRKKKISRENYIRKLTELYDLRDNLEHTLSEHRMHNFKELNIRNLKIFKETCKYVFPYIATGIICTSIFKLNDKGLPFVKDEIPHYMEYSLEYLTDGYLVNNNVYSRKHGLEDGNHLIVYTPWEFVDGKYYRYRREYDAGKICTKEVYHAVLSNDYNYIRENIKVDSEIQEVADSLLENESTDIFFDVSINFYDKSDFVLLMETDKNARIVSILTIVISLIGGFLKNSLSDIKYIEKCKNINNDYYNYRLVAIRPIKEKIDRVNDDIRFIMTKNEVIKHVRRK